MAVKKTETKKKTTTKAVKAEEVKPPEVNVVEETVIEEVKPPEVNVVEETKAVEETKITEADLQIEANGAAEEAKKSETIELDLESAQTKYEWVIKTNGDVEKLKDVLGLRRNSGRIYKANWVQNEDNSITITSK